MQLEILTLSNAGGRAVNEDTCGIWSNNAACFCVVSDGAGGHGGGDVASRLVVQHTLDWFKQHPECSREAIATALQAANHGVIQEQRNDPRIANMRATAVVVAIDTHHDRAIWGHIGDSRLYCFHDHRIVAQTRDHSVLQRMVDAGYLPPEQLRRSPERSKLFAALGDDRHFQPHIEETAFPLRDGDALLLCTDGFWEHVEESEMEHLLATSATPENWLRTLEGLVNHRGGGDAGQDNYSAIAVSCSDWG
jgi:serine/threonine protein phosphatase PrpC